MTFEEWLTYGHDQGWISHPTCATHNGVPSTEDEEIDWELGYDPCQHVVRLWPQD